MNRRYLRHQFGDLGLLQLTLHLLGFDLSRLRRDLDLLSLSQLNRKPLLLPCAD